MDIAIYTGAVPYKTLMKDHVVELLRQTPIKTVHVNVEGMDGREKISLEEAQKLAEKYRYHFHMRGVLWPKQYFNAEYVDKVYSYGDIFGSPEVMDLEPNWKGANDGEDALLLQHFPSARMTTHTGHELVARPKTGAAARLCHELEVQALSTKKEKWGSHLAAPRRQRFAYERGLQTQGMKPFITLPLWNQKYEGRHVHEPMKLAARECVKLEVPGISYWSLRWFLRNTYAQTFLIEELPKILRED